MSATTALSSALLLSSTSASSSTLEVNNKDVFKCKTNDQNDDQKNQKELHKNKEDNVEIKDDYFTLPPKALLSPTTTRDIYENRLKSASIINYQPSESSTKISTPASVLASPPVTTTTVTAQRRRDLKLKAEQQNHDQIELSKASLRQGDEVAL